MGKITHYSFGSITVDGKTYASDVIIYPDRVNPSWWRNQGHRLQPADLGEVVESGIKTLVIGTGASGLMQVPKETVRFLESKGIEAHALKTSDAVEFYNRTSGDRPVVAALHLTC
jgi:hypothetical protein